jgi:hypothetical protein
MGMAFEVLKRTLMEGLRLGEEVAAEEEYVFSQRITVEARVTVPANTPANASNNIYFTIDPKVGAVLQHTIPKDFRYVLVDAFIKSASDVGVDGTAKLKRNFFTDHIVTPPISTLLVSNPSRPAVAVRAWDEGDVLSGEFINLAPTGNEARTVVFYLVFDVYIRVY